MRLAIAPSLKGKSRAVYDGVDLAAVEVLANFDHGFSFCFSISNAAETLCTETCR
jgi:hypothetical protein